MEQRGTDSFHSFLTEVRQGTHQTVKISLLFDKNTEANEKCGSDKLLEALEERNIAGVWKLIAEKKFTATLDSLNEVCKTVAENENNKETLCKYIRNNYNCKKICEKLKTLIQFHKEAVMQSEERKAIQILSDPLYKSLEWLWRINPESQYEKDTGPQVQRKFTESVIEAVLHDAYLLEKIAAYEHHYSRDEYMKLAKQYEEYAADIVGQVKDKKQLYEIMDIEGKGALMKKRHDDFNQSVSLLKMAADKQRKKFVASPKCQFALNEVIYHGSRGWKDMGIVMQTLWFFVLQLILVTVTIPLYIPLKLTRKTCMCRKVKGCCSGYGKNVVEYVRMLYEQPHSKFLNHTMSYMIFLGFVFASSFEYKFGPGGAGLTWIDLTVIAFIIALLIQEFLEACKQGVFVYFSKWWNVIDTLIIFLFVLAYILWFVAFRIYGEWRPEKGTFIVADTVYASASVVAFFHLAHFFQVSSVLGPLQLSLYKMLKDVLRFLAIFLLLYVAFATGVAKIYSYYVASQVELKMRDDSTGYHQVSHPFALHANTFIVLFWMLFGGGGEEKIIAVGDQNFHLITVFGRVFMGAYVICTIIVALSMLVAMMNDSFHTIKENEEVEWKFSRTEMWLEWIDKGNTVPAPFNIPYVVLRVLLWFLSGCFKSLCCREKQDNEEGTCCCEVVCCAGGIPGCNFERCNCFKNAEASKRKERIEIMKDLVVEYLKKRYKANWEEHRAKTSYSKAGGRRASTH